MVCAQVSRRLTGVKIRRNRSAIRWKMRLERDQKKNNHDNDKICTCAGEPNRYRKAEAIQVCRLNYFWEVRKDLGRGLLERITSATLSISNFDRKLYYLRDNIQGLNAEEGESLFLLQCLRA
jgi:hypothetical protein